MSSEMWRSPTRPGVASQPSSFTPMSAMSHRSEYRVALSQEMPQTVQAYYDGDVTDPNREFAQAANTLHSLSMYTCTADMHLIDGLGELATSHNPRYTGLADNIRRLLNKVKDAAQTSKGVASRVLAVAEEATAKALMIETALDELDVCFCGVSGNFSTLTSIILLESILRGINLHHGDDAPAVYRSALVMNDFCDVLNNKSPEILHGLLEYAASTQYHRNSFFSARVVSFQGAIHPEETFGTDAVYCDKSFSIATMQVLIGIYFVVPGFERYASEMVENGLLFKKRRFCRAGGSDGDCWVPAA